jgi:hypothetical protein
VTNKPISFRQLPPGGGSPREVAEVVNKALRGKINSTGVVTLATGAATTTVNNALVGALSVILLMPQTAHAAAELQNGTIYIKPSDIVEGVSFKITHANDANADKTFAYVILG